MQAIPVDFVSGNRGDIYMKMIRVNSSAIAAVGYDAQSMQMRITFQQGRTYDFCGVPQRIMIG